LAIKETPLGLLAVIVVPTDEVYFRKIERNCCRYKTVYEQHGIRLETVPTVSARMGEWEA